MDSNIEKIIKSVGTDSSGRWVSINDVEQIVLKAIETCIELVEDTPEHCAITTHDLSAVRCTIDKSVDKIRSHFNIKQFFGVFK